MEQNNQTQALEISKVLEPSVVAMQDKFAVACQTAASLQLQNNATAAFQAVCVVKMMRDALTDQVVKQVFEPLMNTKIGFRTDKDPNRPRKKKDGTFETPKPYSTEVVRDCIIDAVINGLMPTGNQFNIISGTMYPTKEGYAALLKKIGCKYMISYRTTHLRTHRLQRSAATSHSSMTERRTVSQWWQRYRRTASLHTISSRVRLSAEQRRPCTNTLQAATSEMLTRIHRHRRHSRSLTQADRLRCLHRRLLQRAQERQ